MKPRLGHRARSDRHRGFVIRALAAACRRQGRAVFPDEVAAELTLDELRELAARKTPADRYVSCSLRRLAQSGRVQEVGRLSRRIAYVAAGSAQDWSVPLARRVRPRTGTHIERTLRLLEQLVVELDRPVRLQDVREAALACPELGVVPKRVRTDLSILHRDCHIRSVGRHHSPHGGRLFFLPADAADQEPPQQAPRRKERHRDIVIRCLSAACERRGQAAFPADVAEELTAEELKDLTQHLTMSPRNYVAHTLRVMERSGRIALVARVSGAPCYVISACSGPKDIPSRRNDRPRPGSHMERTLQLLEALVAEEARPVRLGDLREAAPARPEFGVDSDRVRNSLVKLKAGAFITVVGTARDNRSGGRLLFLPAGLEPEDRPAIVPLTPQEVILDHILKLWHETASEARLRGERPRPMSINEIRARLHEEGHPVGHLRNLISGFLRGSAPLKLVAIGDPPVQHFLPSHISLNDVDCSGPGSSKTGWIVEAIRRAMATGDEPAVSSVAVQALAEAEDLGFSGPRDVTVTLSATSARHKGRKDGGSTRGSRAVRVGHVGNVPYYTVLPQGQRGKRQYVRARRYVRALRGVEGWERAVEQHAGYDSEGVAAPFAKGRAALLRSVALLLCEEMEVAMAKPGTEAAEEQLKTARMSIECRLREVETWLNGAVDDVPEVRQAAPNATGSDLVAMVLRNVAHFGVTSKAVNYLFYLHRADLAKVVHPEFRAAKYGPKYLFDQAGLLMAAASRWGGPETSTQAQRARMQLGPLRDDRFALEAGQSGDTDTRFAGVAALAFLRPPNGEKVLKAMVKGEADAALRRSALWAYGFAEYPEGLDLARSVLLTDSSYIVRHFAQRAAQSGAWWAH